MGPEIFILCAGGPTDAHSCRSDVDTLCRIRHPEMRGFNPRAPYLRLMLIRLSRPREVMSLTSHAERVAPVRVRQQNLMLD